MPDNSSEQEKQQHIALEAMQAGQDFIKPRAEGFIQDMKNNLAKKIQELLKARNITDMDNILVAAITLATGENAESVITKLLDVKRKFKSQNIDNIILTATFYDLDTKYLFGGNNDPEDKTFPRRLDKVTKIITETTPGTDGGTETVEREVGFNLDWNNVNNWDWPDFIEPLNINFTGNQKIDSLKAQLSIFPKIAYTYVAIRSAGGSSSFDSLNSSFVFPFWEEQLSSVTYTSAYGYRESGFHYGVDLAAPVGTEIHAADDGTVSYAWPASDGNGGGNRIAIAHPNNLYSIYMHMNDLICSVGQQISKGQVIGHVGYTGTCRPVGPDGAHLHFQINQDSAEGKFGVDPARYFERLGGISTGTNLGSVQD